MDALDALTRLPCARRPNVLRPTKSGLAAPVRIATTLAAGQGTKCSFKKELKEKKIKKEEVEEV